MTHLWLDLWRENQRIAARALWRAGAWFVHRRLRLAGQNLGELGWQCADFSADDPTARGLDSVEREQAGLLFEISGHKEQLAQLKTRVLEKTTALRADLQNAEDMANQSEARALQLLEVLAMEKSRNAPDYLLDSMVKFISEEEAALREKRTTLHTSRETLSRHEQQSRGEMDRLQAMLKSLETQLQKLQQIKITYFSDIGQALADAAVAPPNQPEVLAEVLALRQKSDRMHSELADSLAQSARLSWLTRWAARLVSALILLALGLLFFLLLIRWMTPYHG